MMLQKDNSKWPMVVCEHAGDVPVEGLKIVRPEILALLGNPVDVLFPAFAIAFPHSAAAMKAHWVKPKLLVAPVGLDWIATIVLEGPDTKNIRIKLRFFEDDFDAEYFDGSHRMLPEKWKELYRWFESFGVTEYPFGRSWINTPFHYSGRLNPEQYRQRVGAKKQAIRDFEKLMASNKMECWLLTEAGDTLWLDEQRCDHKVYHLRGIDFKDVGVIENPAEALDAYLAHFLSGGKPVDFDFYKWRSPANAEPKQGFLAKLFDIK